jgi:hypothetical protein
MIPFAIVFTLNLYTAKPLRIYHYVGLASYISTVNVSNFRPEVDLLPFAVAGQYSINH